jgi:hypothetical protein
VIDSMPIMLTVRARSAHAKVACDDANVTPSDYQSKEHLFYQINLALKAVGNSLFIRFSKFRHILQ